MHQSNIKLPCKTMHQLRPYTGIFRSKSKSANSEAQQWIGVMFWDQTIQWAIIHSLW